MQETAAAHAPSLSPRAIPSAKPLSSQRLLPLDGLRGVAILLVLIHHFLPMHMPTVLGRWAGRFASSAWVGVDLFFVLSGFLITGILLDTRGKPRFFRNFYARRTLRVFPLYFGALAVTLLIIPLARSLPLHLREQRWLWLYASNLYPLLRHQSYSFPSDLNLQYTHFWSLAVEEHFYLVWPLVVFLLPRRPLMWAAAGLSFMAMILKWRMQRAGFSPDVLYQTTFLRMDGLLLGGWAAMAFRGGCDPRLLRRGAKMAAAVFGTVLAVMFIRDAGLYRGKPDVEIVGYSCVALFFTAVLVLAAAPSAGWLQRILVAKWLGFLGLYSYGIYVFHCLLMAVFASMVPQTMPGAEYVTAVVSVSGSILAAVISYQVYEKRFLGLKRQFA